MLPLNFHPIFLFKIVRNNVKSVTTKFYNCVSILLFRLHSKYKHLTHQTVKGPLHAPLVFKSKVSNKLKLLPGVATCFCACMHSDACSTVVVRSVTLNCQCYQFAVYTLLFDVDKINNFQGVHHILTCIHKIPNRHHIFQHLICILLNTSVICLVAIQSTSP